MCPPHLESFSRFPPHPLVVLEHRLWGALLHSLNLHWSTILHMVMYMFQCHSLKSSHPHFLALSPKVCSLCLCLLSCHACRIVSTIFLDSICMHSVQFSRSFVSSSLQPHEPQYARPPCPSPTPRTY